MGSYDMSWTIERYPDHEVMQTGETHSGYCYGCPDLGLMGYTSLEELFQDMLIEINKGDRKRLIDDDALQESLILYCQGSLDRKTGVIDNGI